MQSQVLNMRASCNFFCLVGAFVLSASAAHADWLNTTGAETAPNFVEIEIREDRVRVNLEIDFSDYPAFVPGTVEPVPSGVEPNAADLSRATGAAFGLESDGVAITPQIRTIEIRDRKPRPTAQPGALTAPPPRGARVIAAELEFPLVRRPEVLTFIPPRDEEGLAVVSLGLLTHHGGVPVTDYRYLSQTERLALDWDDPWYSAFENPNLSRHHRSALMSFVSIEPRELRHEIVFRLRDLEGWTELDLGQEATLDATQRGKVVEAAQRFLAGLGPIVMDGQELRPKTAKVVFLQVGAEGVRIVEGEEVVDRATALLGALLCYPQRTLPQKVNLTWQLFAEGAQEVPISVSDPAGPVPAQVTPDAPDIAWTNVLKTWTDPSVEPVRVDLGLNLPIPVLSLLLFAVAAAFGVEASRARRPSLWAALALLAGVAALMTVRGPALTVELPGGPDDKAATRITSAIARNAAVAMLETEPENFASALESFVVQTDIESIGAEMQRGLSVWLPSGARGLTDSISQADVEDVTAHEDGLSVLARWTAHVSGGHWGHTHRRQIDYRALMDLAQSDGVWRLRGLTILSARPRTPEAPQAKIEPQAKTGPAI